MGRALDKHRRHPLRLLEGQRLPSAEDECEHGHFWHILAEDPKFAAYCRTCGKLKRRGKRTRP